MFTCINAEVSVLTTILFPGFSGLAKLEPDIKTDKAQCYKTLNSYEQLTSNFINLHNALKDNTTQLDNRYLTKIIDDYQTSLYNYTPGTNLYSNCYWFEEYLWWRKGPKLKCFADAIQKMTFEDIQITDLNSLKSHIRGMWNFSFCPVYRCISTRTSTGFSPASLWKGTSNYCGFNDNVYKNKFLRNRSLQITVFMITAMSDFPMPPLSNSQHILQYYQAYLPML